MPRVRGQAVSFGEPRKSDRKPKLSLRFTSSDFFDPDKRSSEGSDEGRISPYPSKRRRSSSASISSSSYQCEICQKTFTSKASLKWHVNSHTREVTLPCTECKRTFLRPDYVTAHLKAHRTAALRAQVPDLPHKCTEAGCSRSFSQVGQLEHHLKQHKFTCAFCNRTATSRRLINYHIMEHTDEFPEQCKKCKKWFTAQSTFLAHKCCQRKIE